MDPRGSWAATISLYIRLIHFWVPHLGTQRLDPIRELHLLTFFVVFVFSNLEEGTWISVVSWRTQLWKIPLCRKKIDVRFFESLENSEKVREFWSSLGGPHSATNSDSIREMHFWTFSVFLRFQT